MNATKVILVGRHTSELPADIEVVEQRNIAWSTNRDECRKQYYELLESLGTDKAVLFQNIPGILASVMMREAFAGGVNAPRHGVIISVPGERKSAIEKRFGFDEPQDAQDAADAALMANPNARIEWTHGSVFVLTVDPPTPFVFSHIEWF